MIDVGWVFSFPFHQKEWGLKLLIGSLFLLLSIAGVGIPVVAGYTISVCQRVMNNEAELLPEWSDVGVLFITGIKYVVVTLLYQLPILLLVLPIMFFAVVSSLSTPSDSAALIFGFYLLGFLFLAIPYALLFALLTPIITYRFALREKVSDGLDVAAVFRDFRKQWASVTLSAILIVIVSVLSILGILFFLVGVLATIFYSSLVSAGLSGVLYRSLKATAGGNR